MNRLFWTIVLCTMLYAVVSPSVATASECASSQVIYTRRATSIREEPKIRAETVRYAKLGERFEVISSTRTNVSCWLQTSDGWLFDNPVLVSANPPGEATTQSGCSPAAVAYITGAMNIRASASTSSSVVARAGPGDSFNVLESRAGATWCWLRIGEGWLANTARVQPTRPMQPTRPVQRVATRPVAPPAARSDIDNCCFIDRPCTTDRDWQAGFWAYQNNECSAPSEPAASNVVAPQQTTVAPAEVNNCCHIGWDCQTEAEWKQGYEAYQNNQCENPGVIVIGSEAFKAAIFDALQHLKSRSAYWYAYIVDGLDNIREASGGRVSVTTHSADVTWGRGRGTASSRDLGAIAATLAHEACHVHRRRAGLQPGGLVGERACLQTEIQVLDVLGSSPQHRNWLQEVLDNINDRNYQWWH